MIVEKVKVRLVNYIDELIAEGEIDIDRFESAVLIKRNDLFFRYVGFKKGSATFRECVGPVEISEF